MIYDPTYALLLAVGLALVLPEPARWHPLALARRAARTLARDLPQAGWTAVAAGILLLVLIGAPAAAATWVLTCGVPFGLLPIAPAPSRSAALVLTGGLLRLTFDMPPVWQWRSRARQPARRLSEAEPRVGAEFAAPLLLFALLGIFAPVLYRAAIEVARGCADLERRHPAASAALLLVYAVAAPAQRLVTLFAVLAAREGEVRSPTPQAAPAASQHPAAALGTIALALLITIW